MRRLFAVVGLLLTGMVTTACIPPILDACPAIGYITGLQVDATGIPAATWVQLCDDATCSPAPGTASDATLTIGANENGGVWAFSFHSGAVPEAVTIRVTDSTRQLLQESEHQIDWTHSTARCGGPSTTPVIVLAP